MTDNQNIRIVELRSDTFTKPSQKMREAMALADVGDAVYDEDPTTNRLQDELARLSGKEAAIFLPSSTMSNLSAVMSHCDERGCEVIIGDRSHYHMWESGGMSQLACVYSKQIENLEDGTFDLEKLLSYINDHTDRQCTKTKLICLENTHNYTGGRVLPIDFIEKVSTICKENNIKLHLDGARLFNAAVALNTDIKSICKYFDSVSICLSKGIGAPVGSILVGTKEFIARAIRARQVLGGGMRQSGVLAAPCLVGLEDYQERLKIDHDNAILIAQNIEKYSCGLIKSIDKIETNIVHAYLTNKNFDTKTFIKRLREVTDDEVVALNDRISLRFGYVDKYTFRILTHCCVSEDDIKAGFKKLEYVSKSFIKNS